MMSQTTYYYDLIPEVPFSAYFMKDEVVSPKRMFTITRKRLNEDQNTAEVFVMEMGRFIEYNPKLIVKVAECFPN